MAYDRHFGLGERFAVRLAASLKAGLAATALLALAASPATAVGDTGYPPARNGCQNTQSFEAWLPGMKKDALAAGIRPETVALVLDGATPEMSILRSDRGQAFFQQTFLEFYAKLATQNRVNSGAAKIRLRKPVFDAVQKEFGVPAEVITAFWALESDFGAGMGKKPVLKALVTLAWDCRRSEMFRDQVIHAMKIIDRGDLKPDEMIGSWAGELGQTQFLPVHYFNHAIDYDKDGRRDLIRSDPDIIASTASFIRSLGWKAGEPWVQEVRIPASLPWEKSGLDIKQPRSEWSKLGVTFMDGRPVPADAMPVSLVLPMGRLGPAFLAYQNFDVYLKWNQSLTYALTAAHLATRIAGAPVVSRGSGQPTALDTAGLKELQILLAKRGHKVGEPDGKLGAGTRIASREAQKKAGLPADGYPTVELLEAVRAGR